MALICIVHNATTFIHLPGTPDKTTGVSKYKKTIILINNNNNYCENSENDNR